MTKTNGTSMLYHARPEIEQVGLARFKTWRVLELDGTGGPNGAVPGRIHVNSGDLERVLDRMAVVIPVCDERVKFLEGVLSGLPRAVDVIVISDSRRRPVDRFHVEREAIESFSRATGREYTVLHQQDPRLSKALEDAGYDELLDEDGFVGHGKGGAMTLGVLLALSKGCEYIGFVDSDNFVPGAVLEHIRNYAAGFAHVESDHVCVREVWNSKPKVRDELVFRKGGRVSRRTNGFLNKLVATHTGFETNVIRTGNAGEHAFNATLARKMPLAAGYAVETWELIWMLERWGGIEEISRGITSTGVDVLQIEARNPHFHEPGDGDHIRDMLASSLGCIYHSGLCPPSLRDDIQEELAELGLEQEPPEPMTLPTPEDGDLKKIAQWLAENQERLRVKPR